MSRVIHMNRSLNLINLNELRRFGLTFLIFLSSPMLSYEVKLLVNQVFQNRGSVWAR